MTKTSIWSACALLAATVAASAQANSQIEKEKAALGNFLSGIGIESSVTLQGQSLNGFPCSVEITREGDSVYAVLHENRQGRITDAVFAFDSGVNQVAIRSEGDSQVFARSGRIQAKRVTFSVLGREGEVREGSALSLWVANSQLQQIMVTTRLDESSTQIGVSDRLGCRYLR